MGAAAGRHDGGIAGHKPHLVRRDPEAGRQAPGQSSSHGPARSTASRRPPRLRAGRLHRHPDIFAGLADRQFDVIGDADAGEPAAFLASRRRPAKPRPIGERGHGVHVGGEIPAVIDEAGRRSIGKPARRIRLRLRSAILSMPEPAAAMSSSRSIAKVASGRPAPRNGAVGTVLVSAPRMVTDGERHVVDRRRHPIGIGERHIGHRVGADISGHLDGEGERSPVGRQARACPR